MDNNSNIIKEIFKSVKYMIDASLHKAPFDRTITGVIVGGSGKKNYYQVMILGKNYELPSFINNNLKPNTTVNIMIPQNNMDLAFIYAIFGGESNIPPEGSIVHADRADYAINAGYASTVAVATTEIVGGLRSSSGKNHVSVDETGIATVTSVDNADNAINAQNAIKAQSAVNADNATNAGYAIRAGTAINVENIPIATEVKIGGIISSTGPGHVQVDENGIATVPDAGGIKEVPIATDTIVGGLTSSNLSGKVKVDGTTGKSSVNDVVTMKDTGAVEVPENFGDGPWKIICTEDNTPDPVNSGMPKGGEQGDILIKQSDKDYDAYWSAPSPQGSKSNILDNWYFINPINQRGKYTYTEFAYCIDRWINRFCTSISLTSSGLNIDCTVSKQGEGAGLNQGLELPSRFLGKTVTCSALVDMSNVNYCRFGLHSATSTAYHSTPLVTQNIQGKVGLVSVTGTLPEQLPSGQTKLNFGFYFSDQGGTAKIIATKLELGTCQTLAYQDSNGNWNLLDSPPNIEQELAKCQRYYLGPITCREAIILSSNAGFLTIHTPVQMNSPATINPAPVTICEYNKITNNIDVSIGNASVGVNGIYTKFIFENFSPSSIVGVIEMFGFTIDSDFH